MRQFYLKILPVLCFVLAIQACDMQHSTSNNAQSKSIFRVFPAQTIWERMASDFQMQTYANNSRVQYFIKMYTKTSPQRLTLFSEQAKPYVYHIVNMLEAKQMPAELALLPIVESEYMPSATSKVGAAGLWQLASMTGRIYGLKQDHLYDGRRDVDEATRAALTHLQYLYEEFNQDWLLALAAYNCGDGRVKQAIRANKKLGKPTDYWSLKLPQETMYFVPKFLAFAYLVQNAKKLNVQLEPIENQPYFVQVELNAPLDFQTAAKLAKTDVAEIKKLNPGFKKHVTHAHAKGEHKILLPVANAATFKANLALHKAKHKATQKVAVSNIKSVHTVNSGIR